MFKLRAILLFSSVVAISGGFLSDEVKQIDFRKVHDGSKELNFEYQLDDGSTFNGTAYLLNINEAHTYILIGANDDIYWVKFTDSEFRNATELRKMVRSVLKIDDTVFFLDDFNTYNLKLSTATLKAEAYLTVWDSENVCFMNVKDDKGDHVKFVMKSKNNSRKYEGTLTKEKDSKHWQFKILDKNWGDELYRVEFTDCELASNQQFCKEVIGDEIVDNRFSFDQFITTEIDQNLLKALVG